MFMSALDLWLVICLHETRVAQSEGVRLVGGGWWVCGCCGRAGTHSRLVLAATALSMVCTCRGGRRYAGVKTLGYTELKYNTVNNNTR